MATLAAGRPLGIMDLSSIEGAELLAAKGTTATIEWGVHLFVVDATKGVVSLTTESRINGDVERGIGERRDIL